MSDDEVLPWVVGDDVFFWRAGYRWFRQPDGREHRLVDLAPNLERRWMADHIEDVVSAARAEAMQG